LAAGVLPGMWDVARHERASAGPADRDRVADHKGEFAGEHPGDLVAVAVRRWLTLRGGQTWHCIIGVPRPLRATLGKSHLIKSLHTTDLPVARQRRWHVLAEFRDTIARASGANASPDLIATALAHRAMVEKYAAGDLRGFHADTPHVADTADMQALAIDLAVDALREDAESIAERYGPSLART
jgi:hypothetical protein